MAEDKVGGDSLLDTSASSDHDPQFEPIITLPEVCVPTMEEEEEELVKLRAKLFRYDTKEDPPEWKERGTGDVKLLRHKINNRVRVVMRRDKTHKICANHYVAPWMELKPNCKSDKAWVYSVPADYADEFIQPQLLAIKFGTAENAKKWKDKFEEAKAFIEDQQRDNKDSSSEKEDVSDDSGGEEENDTGINGVKGEDDLKVTDELKKLQVKEDDKNESKEDKD